MVVDQAVVGVAEEHEVGQFGAATEQPVPHVVGVQPFDAGLRAAGAGAAAVAAQQRPALPPVARRLRRPTASGSRPFSSMTTAVASQSIRRAWAPVIAGPPSK